MGSELSAMIGDVSWATGIVRWQDIRAGDLVLLDDGLVVAEHVNICQKPWGDGTTFTVVDISHRLDNGVLVSSERHGDRLTAARRPAAQPDLRKRLGEALLRKRLPAISTALENAKESEQ